MSALSDCPPETAANICKLIEDVKNAFVQGELTGLIILPLTADGNTMGILAGETDVLIAKLEIAKTQLVLVQINRVGGQSEQPALTPFIHPAGRA